MRTKDIELLKVVFRIIGSICFGFFLNAIGAPIWASVGLAIIWLDCKK